jgi:hypothetical protein
MKKLCLVVLGCIAIFTSLTAQSLIDDALALKPYFAPSGNRLALLNVSQEEAQKVANILARYTDQKNIELAFEENIFFSTEKVPNADIRMLADAAKGASPSSFVTYFADGLAKFIATRTKQELTNAFFRRFKSDLDNFPVLDTLFPATGLLLRRIDTEIYFFDRYIDDLRIHFIKDLERLPTGLRELVVADRSRLRPAERLWMADLLQVSQMFLDGFGVKESLDYLASDETQMFSKMREISSDTTEFRKVANLAGIFRTSHLLMQAVALNPEGNGTLRDDQNAEPQWIAPEKLYKALNDPIARDLILGLLYQQGAKIEFAGAQAQLVPFQEIMSSVKAEVPKLEVFKNALNDMVTDLRQAQSSMRAVKALNPDDQNKVATYYRLFDAAFGAFQAGIKIKNIFTPPRANEDTKLFFVIRQLSELNMHLRSKAYGSAVINVGNVIDTLSWKLLTNKRKSLKAGEPVVEKSSFSSYFWRYGSFMAAVAEAKNSDEVAYAIDRIALPPGSAAMKKSNAFSLMINAYGGINAGVEFLGQGIGKDRDAKTLLAPWAPLGFDLSFGNKKGNGSTGLFLPFIDVGALAAFRLGDTQSADVPQLKWSNIIAPGAYLVFGFSKAAPISLSIGGQLGPNLRKVNTQGITLDDQRGYRIGASLAIDIPVLRLVGGQK